MSGSKGSSYWQATRHPAPCLLFVLPLLIIYEFGVVAIGGPQSLSLRNGADAWMRWLLASAGLGFGLLAPLLVTVILFAWTLRAPNSPPNDMPGVVLGMALESVSFALVLFGLSRAFGPMLDSLGVDLATRAGDGVTSPMAQVITYLGAGIYEETIFRLGLFAGVVAMLRCALISRPVAMLIAATVSSIGFAVVHHVGAQGEVVTGYVFLFRALAGLMFTLLFVLRGFGITVGAHACYDVLVGINV